MLSLLSKKPFKKACLITCSLLALSACKAELAKHEKPIPYALKAKMEQLNIATQSPVFMRIFKEEAELEVWKMDKAGKYQLLKTYDICKWSGELGPKKYEGDRQAPEGFYTIRPHQMNPNSSFHLAFNLGYPNAFDKAHGRTGSFLMVHGACSSRGCYAMNDDQIEEIYALGREAFYGGQRAFQVQALPFRMSPKNLARYSQSEHFDFWQMLKQGSDHFEITRQTPKIDVCDQRYVFNAKSDEEFIPDAPCPSYTIESSLQAQLSAKQMSDYKAFQEELANLSPDELMIQPASMEREEKNLTSGNDSNKSQESTSTANTEIIPRQETTKEEPEAKDPSFFSKAKSAIGF